VADQQLRYRVPDHQDPAVLVAALAAAGYSSELAEPAGERIVTVRGRDGGPVERAAVREVLGSVHAGNSATDDTRRGSIWVAVRFLDEVADRPGR
jgi:hypothetical protein